MDNNNRRPGRPRKCVQGVECEDTTGNVCEPIKNALCRLTGECIHYHCDGDTKEDKDKNG